MALTKRVCIGIVGLAAFIVVALILFLIPVYMRTGPKTSTIVTTYWTSTTTTTTSTIARDFDPTITMEMTAITNIAVRSEQTSIVTKTTTSTTTTSRVPSTQAIIIAPIITSHQTDTVTTTTTAISSQKTTRSTSGVPSEETTTTGKEATLLQTNTVITATSTTATSTVPSTQAIIRATAITSLQTDTVTTATAAVSSHKTTTFTSGVPPEETTTTGKEANSLETDTITTKTTPISSKKTTTATSGAPSEETTTTGKTATSLETDTRTTTTSAATTSRVAPTQASITAPTIASHQTDTVTTTTTVISSQKTTTATSGAPSEETTTTGKEATSLETDTVITATSTTATSRMPSIQAITKAPTITSHQTYTVTTTTTAISSQKTTTSASGVASDETTVALKTATDTKVTTTIIPLETSNMIERSTIKRALSSSAVKTSDITVIGSTKQMTMSTGNVPHSTKIISVLTTSDMSSIMKLLVYSLVFIQTIYSLELKKLSTCQTALGMQSGAIPDLAISASSSYNSNTVGPKASRARTEQYGGAWCPLNQITSVPNEWLEINFGNLTYLTQVETQGRFDNGQGKEYADYYILMYTRSNNMKNDETLWIEYKPKLKDKNSTWIRANQNTYMGEIRQLNPPIVAQRLRFYPVSKQIRTVCMRVEAYGCLFSDGIISYSMPQGRTDINSFGDNTYDGNYIPSTNMLINGLGQLSDGITGTEEISVINGRQPWVGWSNDTSRYISIKFQFDSIRQINRVTIHTNNLFSKEILIFKSAIISFSLNNDETNYSNSVIYQHTRDDIFEIARPILIELNNHIGKFVRLDLYFDSKWLLISEITFDSQIYTKAEKKNEIKEKNLRKSFTIGTDSRKRHREIQLTTSMNSRAKVPSIITVELSLAFLIGALIAIGILLILSLLWIVRRKKKLQFQKLTEKPCSNSSCYTYPTLPIREFYDLNAPIASTIDDRDYAIPDVNLYSTFSPIHNVHSPHLIPNSYPTLKPISHCCRHEQQYLTMRQQSAILFSSAKDVTSIEATCGNSLMIKMNMIAENQQISIKELNSDEIVLGKKIGDGLFGSIHLAEMHGIHKDNKMEKQNVIVKSLNDNVDDNQKASFWKEIELLSTLHNSNVCSLLGVLNSQRTVAVFEYYSLDLYQYLRQQLIPLDHCSASSFVLSLACQIASGMTYLSSLQIIHRDLATRNCLISPINHQLYLTDIAMVKSEYSNDYARIGHLQSRIAIRWAALESIFLNQFSLKSDVWSFGVTLYELFTYARQRPYYTLTNEQLVQQFAALSQTQLSPALIINNLHLPQPALCSKEIYDMMCECWQKDALSRPSFADIHTFLLGKASGSTLLVSPGL